MGAHTTPCVEQKKYTTLQKKVNEQIESDIGKQHTVRSPQALGIHNPLWRAVTEGLMRHEYWREVLQLQACTHACIDVGGALFLAGTIGLEDMLLNCMALEFILSMHLI